MPFFSPCPRMPGRRAALLVACSAAGAAALVAVPSAAAAAAPSGPKVAFSTVPLTFTTTVGPKGSERTCAVDGDLRIPATATTATPAPAILTTNGFGGSKDSTGPNGNASYAARFAELGYVTLSYSGLGFGRSGCDITIDDPQIDGRAGSSLVSFLGGAPGIATTKDGQPYAIAGLVVHDTTDHDGAAQQFDPRVGMIGGSYGGEIQYAIAGVDARMDALAPIYTWNDLDYSLAPNNVDLTGVGTATPGASKYQWQTLFFGLGGVQLVTNPEFTINPSCPGTRVEVCVAAIDANTTGFPSPPSRAFQDSVSVASYIEKIRIPTLLSQGQADTLFNLQEAIATFRSLKTAGTPVKMVWQSWGHSDGTPAQGELDTGTAAPGTGTLDQTVQGRIFIDWFDHWLKDVPNDLGPDLRYFRDYAYAAPAAEADPATKLAAASAAYASSGYPTGPSQVLQLSGGGALVGRDAAVTEGSQTFNQPSNNSPTSYSETSAVGPLAPQTDTAGTFAAWTTGPLESAIDVAGVPTLDVRISAPAAAATQGTGPAGQLVLFAKIYDVAPDGSQSLVHGLQSPLRIADVTKPLRIELPGIVHRYAAGHQLKLVLAAGDSAHKGNLAPATVTVLDDPAAPGVLSLPLGSSEVVGAPAPVIPEAPVAVLLPMVAAGLAGVVLARRRRAA